MSLTAVALALALLDLVLTPSIYLLRTARQHICHVHGIVHRETDVRTCRLGRRQWGFFEIRILVRAVQAVTRGPIQVQAPEQPDERRNPD